MRGCTGAGAENCHETVAQEFVDHTAVFRFHDFDHGLKKSIEKIDDRFRIGLGRARGKSTKVEKKESDDLIGATETRIAGQDLLRDFFPDVQTKNTAQPFLVAQLDHHLIEIANQRAELIGPPQRNLHIELALADGVKSGA